VTGFVRLRGLLMFVRLEERRMAGEQPGDAHPA
jgi:hypothetical protein